MKFWLNRSTTCDSDLRKRVDVPVIKVDAHSINFNLTGSLEGNYTCGRVVTQGNGIIIEESNPVTLICKFTAAS